MQTEKETKMLSGAVVACMMPMMLGAFSFALMLQNLEGFQSSRSFSDAPYFYPLPIVLCFLFGTPLAALMACARLGDIRSLGHGQLKQSAIRFGVQSASAVHFWAALIYTLTALMFFFPNGETLEGAVIQWIWVLLASATINVLLWAIITLPLSLFSATLFCMASKSPHQTVK